MTCEHCGEAMIVVREVEVNGQVLRVYECPYCGADPDD